jgi:hypothetical protein
MLETARSLAPHGAPTWIQAKPPFPQFPLLPQQNCQVVRKWHTVRAEVNNLTKSPVDISVVYLVSCRVVHCEIEVLSATVMAIVQKSVDLGPNTVFGVMVGITVTVRRTNISRGKNTSL